MDINMKYRLTGSYMLTIVASGIMSGVVYSCPIEGKWMSVNPGGVTYTFIREGKGCTIESIVDSEDGEQFEVSKIVWNDNTLKWVYRIPSNGFVASASIVGTQGEKLEISWVGKESSGMSEKWKSDGINLKLKRELLNEIYTFFGSSKDKVKKTDITIAKLENFEISELVYSMSISADGKGGIQVINGRSYPFAGSDVEVRMSDPARKSKDKLTVKGWAKGNGSREFHTIHSIDVADGVKIETTDGNMYKYSNGFWRIEISLVREAQKILSKLGYDIGPIDGIVGQRTKNAVRSFEIAQGVPETGIITKELVDLLKNNRTK